MRRHVIVRLVAAVLGAGLTLNAMAMLFVPHRWYDVTPGVDDTGPFNPHFVRDIGSAYLVAGLALIALARWGGRAWAAAVAGAAFLSVHAAVHGWELATDRESTSHLPMDLVLIFAPAVLALGCVWLERSYARA
jgi:hypothetical protein